MKYLKLYEDHGPKLYYKFSNLEDFQNFRGGEFNYAGSLLDIDESVMDLVKDLLDKQKIGYTISYNTVGIVLNHYLIKKKYIYIELYNSIYKSVEIYQLMDEWFHLNFSFIKKKRNTKRIQTKLFWCDQLDGLMQCLKDNLKV